MSHSTSVLEPEWTPLSPNTKSGRAPGSCSLVSVGVATAVSEDVGDPSLPCGSGAGGSQGKPRQPSHRYCLLKVMVNECLGSQEWREQTRYKGIALRVLGFMWAWVAG